MQFCKLAIATILVALIGADVLAGQQTTATTRGELPGVRLKNGSIGSVAMEM